MSRASVTLPSFACAMLGVSMLLPNVAMADVVYYEYLTIAGASQTVGASLLTDYVPKSNTVIRAKYASSSNAGSNNNQFLYCSRLLNTQLPENLHFSFLPNATGKFRFDYYGTHSAPSASFTANCDYELLVGGGKAYVTDTTTGAVVAELGSGLQSFVPQYKMAFFKSYTYDGGAYGNWSNAFHGRFYYIRIYDIEDGEEVLKHNFVPCLEDGEVRLCDLADPDRTRYALTVDSGATIAVGGETIAPEDYIVTESGTITLAAPSSCGHKIVNLASECIFDQTGDVLSEEYAHSFAGFTAGDGSGTFFLGGWWDFSGVGIFSGSSGMSNRSIVFDGSVLREGGDLCLAGTAGKNNTLLLKGGADVTVGKCILGMSTAANQNSA